MKRTPLLEMIVAAGLAIAIAVAPARSQGAPDIPPPEKLVRLEAAAVEVRAGANAEGRLALEIASGWHINANPASPDYMVATQVELAGGGGLTIGAPGYPVGHGLKLGFEESEISVYSGHAEIALPIAAGARAVDGPHTLKGKLRFQACNNQLCLAPATVPFTLVVNVAGGVAAGATPPESTAAAESGTVESSPAAGAAREADSLESAAPGAGFSTGPPSGGTRAAALDNPLARTLNRGGFAAFLTLFLIGLALNLTPCVYPMLGVTVSIFGARRAAPPLQVFGLALVYVLGMALMYSALGLVAAFTGGLFGGFLQNPLVLIAIGLLLAALSLSMFGMYEIQLPAAIRERASAVSATNVAGVFLSGIVVGVFAAPCVGPPVVALLALVGAKGDPWYGFTAFFVLALGLGAPYLVLGTFSNLLQRLPRSGDWMEWMKHLFGVILLALGAFYLMLGVAPDLAVWVPPIALVAGGGYLGFIDQHADRRKWFRVFKRVGGAAAVLGGLAIVATSPKQKLPMQEFTPAALQAALTSGKTAMIDFSADWCVPCHELERFTFTDSRVIAAARQFAAFRADLTRYDSPESEAWRRQYGITGVPTLLFITPDGTEVRESRVEGFIPAQPLLDRMAHAVAASQRADNP